MLDSNSNPRLPSALDPLTEMDHWLVWRYELNEGSDKPTKMPYQALHPNQKAASTKPETWASYDDAVATFEQSRTNSRPFDGIGFTVTGSKIAAFDIDNCRDTATGVIHEQVWDLIRRCNSYTEITPSRTGLRIIGHYNDNPKQGKKAPMPGANGVPIEVYPASGRYITVTGNHLDGTPETLADITGVINEMITELNATASGAPNEAPDDDDDDNDDEPLPAPLTVRLYIRDGGAGQPHAGYGSRSELTFAFITEALRARIGEPASIRPIRVTPCMSTAAKKEATNTFRVRSSGLEPRSRRVSTPPSPS
jgi:hypothetical protein